MTRRNTAGTVVVNRSAVTGRYVTQKYAQNHKSTTVTEHRPAPKSSPKSR